MNETLNNKQIAFVIFNALIGYGVLGLPKTVAEKAGSGGWISILLSTIIVTISMYIITYLGYKYENKTIYEYSEIIVGKFIRNIIIFIYIVYFFLIFSFVSRASSEVIKLTILIKTPIWALCLLYYIITFYAITKRLRVIGRLCEIFGIIVIFIAFLLNVFEFSQGKIINLTPVYNPSKILTYFKATFYLIIPFIGYEILTIIPIDRNLNTKKIFKYTTLTIVFIGILYISEFEACLSVMGPDIIVRYKDALLASIRRIELPALEFLQRLDGILLIALITSVFSTLIIFSYGCVSLLDKIFKNISFNILCVITLTISFIVSQLPNKIETVQKILDYVGYIGLLTAGVIPFVLFIISKFKDKSRVNNNTK